MRQAIVRLRSLRLELQAPTSSDGNRSLLTVNAILAEGWIQ